MKYETLQMLEMYSHLIIMWCLHLQALASTTAGPLLQMTNDKSQSHQARERGEKDRTWLEGFGQEA